MSTEVSPIELHPDAIIVRGPKTTDKSYTVTLEVGEYERLQVAQLLAQSTDKVPTVRFNYETR